MDSKTFDLIEKALEAVDEAESAALTEREYASAINLGRAKEQLNLAMNRTTKYQVALAEAILS